MAGAAVARELSCAAGVRFAVATAADDAEIRRLLRENPMPGAVRLTFEREPDYFQGADLAGADDQTIVGYTDGRLACVGRCSRRECWVDGRVARVGYLAELRLDTAARGQFTLVRDGYRFFRERQREDAAEIYFTSIASDNRRAQRFLEAGLRGMPRYGFLAELATVIVAVPRRPGAPRLLVEPATRERLPEMLRVLNEHGRRHQLAARWTEASLLALERHGLPLSRFLLALEGGRVVACGGLWDQRGFRQTVIRGYSGALAVARPAVNLVGRLLGTPRLPRPGSTLAHGFLSPLAFAPGAEGRLADFIPAFFRPAARLGLEYLTMAQPTAAGCLEAVPKQFSTRRWLSRLYRVSWPEGPPIELAVGRPFLPDVGLL